MNKKQIKESLKINIILLLLLTLPLMQFAATWHVDGMSGSDKYSGVDALSAKKTIQAAIDLCSDDDEILVAAGTYAPINASNVKVTIRSVGGALKTFIDGNDQCRCVTMAGRNSTLIGFTVCKGRTLAFNDYGAAMTGGRAEACIFTKNVGPNAIYYSELRNCLVYNNTSTGSYIVMHSDLYNCTLGMPFGDQTWRHPYVAWDCALYNCIYRGPIYLSGGQPECCHNCRSIDDYAEFVDADGGDFHLVPGSTCVNVGNNDYNHSVEDLDGYDRVKNGVIDLGCYEYGVERPVVTPQSGTTFESSSQTITITCVSTGATIHYTTNGIVPTIDSPVYKKFRISGKTTVKAIAFYDDGTPSDVVVAEYALGTCENPDISLQDGTIFYHSNQIVSISCGEEGTLYYTLDGSEPTTNSLVYVAPFTIDETTTVKAKVFSDKYFDSGVVTSTLTREWVKVGTPTITALDSFSGTKCLVSLACEEPGATLYYTVDGSVPTSSSPRYERSFYVTDSCVVKVIAVKDDYTNSEIAEKSIEKSLGIGDVLGEPDIQFVMGGNANWIEDKSMYKTGTSSMKSANNLPDDQTSEMMATVKGVGTVRFYWRTSCEDSGGQYDWDHAEFHADDKVYYLDGESTDWLEVSYTFSTYGTHTLKWIYTKDLAGKDGSDCVWVDGLALDFDPIPDMGTSPSTDDIAVATFGSADTRIVERVTDAAEYVRYQQWASAVKGSTKRQIKDSPFAWLSFALDASALLTANPKNGDVCVSGIMPTDEVGKLLLNVSIAGVTVGENATAFNLGQVFYVEGAPDVDGEYSSENVSIVFDTPEDGNVKFTAGPKDSSQKTFFMKVKMRP